jgi:dTDP-L-rhamnose 4-epimerase
VSAVLVTGGAGFIGSHLVDALVQRGERVRMLDSLHPLSHPEGPPGHLNPEAELMTGDLRERASVERALEGVDRVFHLGGVVGNGESMVNVRRAVDVNAGGTATLMEAVLARRDRLRRVVAASSMVVYGEGAYQCPSDGVTWPTQRPHVRLRQRLWEPPCPHCGRDLRPVSTDEDAPLRPTSVYGITKRDQEELVLVLGRAYGLETVVLRYLNVYGPRQALGNPYTGVAALFAARVVSGRRPLVFEDGQQLRDLVHVADVVRATLAAMDAPTVAGLALNVATGRPVRVGELAARIARALDSTLEPERTGEFRAGDIRHCFADTTRARELLGFEPRRFLETGIPELAEWVAQQVVRDRSDAAVADLRERGLVAGSASPR